VSVSFELSAANAADYLASSHGITAIAVEELGGGVSNVVLRVTPDRGEPAIVVKQSLEKLRVEQDWFSDREQIRRECEAIRRLHAVGRVPAIVFEDTENCIYAMSAAPEDARPWKSWLMEGTCDRGVVEAIAETLVEMIRVSRTDRAGWITAFGDRTVFDQLRLDPYYRATARRHPDLHPYFDSLIAETLDRQYSIVHGDWSPKNLLVASTGEVTAIDFEVVHYGDPSFDIAFLMNHLLLKTVHLGRDYRWAAGSFFESVASSIGEPWLEPAVVKHLGGLMLARVDGKSPAEYIRTDEARQRVRELAMGIVLDQPRMDVLLGCYPSQ
jgi:5-methylthioribose kinase